MTKENHKNRNNIHGKNMQRVDREREKKCFSERIIVVRGDLMQAYKN